MSGFSRVVLIFAALATAAGLFVALRPEPAPERAATTQPDLKPGAPKPVVLPEPRVKVYRVTVSDGQPVGGVKTFTYQKGRRAKLVFTSAAPLVVHLHGYDREASASRGKPAVISLRASLEGRFEIEDHQSGNQLAVLEVRP